MSRYPRMFDENRSITDLFTGSFVPGRRKGLFETTCLPVLRNYLVLASNDRHELANG